MEAIDLQIHPEFLMEENIGVGKKTAGM